MNCDAVRSLLSAYIDREVSYEEERRIRLHLEDCAACARELEGLRRAKDLLASLPSRELPVEFWPELKAKLTNHSSMGNFPRIRLPHKTGGFGRAFALPDAWLFGTLVPLGFVMLAVLLVSLLAPPRKADQSDLLGTYLREHLLFDHSQPLADRPSLDYIAMEGGYVPGYGGKPSRMGTQRPPAFREPFEAGFTTTRVGMWGD